MPIHTLKLIARDSVAKDTIKLTFSKPDSFTFIAGQYGGFTLINPKEKDDGGINRRFSLFNAPDDNHIEIVTRIQQSAYKKNLLEMPVGAEIKFAGPTGNFVLHDDTSIPAVFIAGGIGIAPFHSIIIDALKNKPQQTILLFYGNNTLQDAAYLSELEALANQHEQFNMIATLSDPDESWQGEKGYISNDLIVKHVKPLDHAIYYVCGSLAMVTALQHTLMELGIDDDKIRVEDFPGY